MKVQPFHTSSDEDVKVYHTYNDCPAGERIIKDGNRLPGAVGRLCDFCAKKDRTGAF